MICALPARPMELAALTALTVVVLSNGCSQSFFRTRTEAPKDPLVMSHLTKGANDPAFAGMESLDEPPDDEPSLRSASISRKLPSAPTDRKPASGQLSRASDFRWVIGRLRHGVGDSNWRLQYGSGVDADPHGGQIALVDDPRLQTFREGDIVRAEGDLRTPRDGQPCYEVRTIVLLGP